MKLYLYGDGRGNYCRGRSPTGRVQYTVAFEAATFFTEEEKDDAEDCLQLGLSLYSVDVAEPTLIAKVLLT